MHRYQEIAEKIGINLNKLSTTTGIPASTIKMAIKRNSAIDRDIAHKIVSVYPQFNEQWIITGEGPVMVPKTSISSENDLYVRLLNDIYRTAFQEKKVESQEDFGAKLGFSNKSYISDLMNGTKKISNKILDRIEIAFGYDAAALLHDLANNVSEPDIAYGTAEKSIAEQVKAYGQAIAAKVMGPGRLGKMYARNAALTAEILQKVEELAKLLQEEDSTDTPPRKDSKKNK